MDSRSVYLPGHGEQHEIRVYEFFFNSDGWPQVGGHLQDGSTTAERRAHRDVDSSRQPCSTSRCRASFIQAVLSRHWNPNANAFVITFSVQAPSGISLWGWRTGNVAAILAASISLPRSSSAWRRSHVTNRCSRCRKYLSIAPVAQHPQRSRFHLATGEPVMHRRDISKVLVGVPSPALQCLASARQRNPASALLPADRCRARSECHADGLSFPP